MMGRLWAVGGALATRCHQKLRNLGDYVGSSSVAHDIVRVADALGENGIRYWGVYFKFYRPNN